MLQLLADTPTMLNDQSELAMTELRNLVAGHMHDLAALMLGARDPGGTRERHARDATGGDQAASSQRIGAHGLTMADIARSQQISESYIRQLFAEDGTSFTDFVLGGRLDRVHRMLVNPLYGDRSVSVIAYDTGFGDVSYFNRTFRRRYGMTPSEVREAAQRPKDG